MDQLLDYSCEIMQYLLVLFFQLIFLGCKENAEYKQVNFSQCLDLLGNFTIPSPTNLPSLILSSGRLDLQFPVYFQRLCPSHTRNYGGNNMGAKTPSPNPHPNPPNNHTIPPLPTLHIHTNPLLPELGLPTSPLLQIPYPPLEMGFLSLPQKGLKIRAPSHLLEVQVPLPTAPFIGSCQRSGWSWLEWWEEKRVC